MVRSTRNVQSGLFRSAIALSALLAAGRLPAAEPRWTPVGPPAAPTFARLVVDPAAGDRVYALTGTALWRSRSDLGSWRNVQFGLAGPPLSLAVDPSHPGRLYAFVAGLDNTTTIRRSDDFGDHWQTVFRLPEPASYYFRELRADPFVPDTLYWFQDRRLQRSRDGGRTWKCFAVDSTCDQYKAVDAFAFAPDRPQTLYAVAGSSFYVTFDRGATWRFSNVFAYEETPEFIVATRAPRTLYAWSGGFRGDLGPCFLRSDDEGLTWKAFLPPKVLCSPPAIDVNDPRTVRIVVVEGGVAQLRISRDGGESWSNAGPLPAFGDLYLLPGKGLALATYKGVFRAASDQGPWRPANRGFAVAEVASVLPTEHGVAAALVQSPNAAPPKLPLLLTEDGGRSWSATPLMNPIALAADPSDPHRLIASARRFEGPVVWHARVLESLDDGHTWRGVVDPQLEPLLYESLAIDPFDPRTIFAGTRYNGFYRSEDGGRTWQASSAGLRFGGCHHYYCETNWVSAILPHPAKSGTIAVRFEQQVYTSRDGGSNWSRRGPSGRPRYGSVTALTREPSGALVAVVESFQEQLGEVYRSADEGLTWQSAGRFPRLPASGRAIGVTALVATPAGLFAGTNVLGVLRSTDGGRTWKSFNQGLPIPSVTSLAADPADPARLFATVPQNGVYSIAVP